MSAEKYLLDLTGRTLDGYRTEEVASSLSQLLRIPRAQARNLLRGKSSRIKRELEKEKAIHLMGKIIACGAQCEINPIEINDDEDPTIEAPVQLPGKLELEIDHSGIDIEEIAAQATAGDRVAMNSMSAGLPAAVASDNFSADSGSGKPTAQPHSVKGVGEAAPETPAGIGGRRQRRLLLAAVAVVLLGLIAWAGQSFLDRSELLPQQDIAEPAIIRPALPEIAPEVAKTGQRMEMLASSVRIWMIQYGAGFDPSQVTMERIQQDLSISLEEMQDGWGTPFRYTAAAGSFTITSTGPDRKFASEDDINLEKSVP